MGFDNKVLEEYHTGSLLYPEAGLRNYNIILVTTICPVLVVTV